MEHPRRSDGNQQADRRTEHDVELVRIGQDKPRVDSGARSQEAPDHEQNSRIEAASELGKEADVESPGDDSGNHHGKENVDVEIVGVVQAKGGRLGSQVENPVRANGGGASVKQIEEPDGAVDEGEPQRQQCIDGAHGQAVEGKLQGLVTGLADFPGDVTGSRQAQCGRQESAMVTQVGCQMTPRRNSADRESSAHGTRPRTLNPHAAERSLCCPSCRGVGLDTSSQPHGAHGWR